ncbi:30S ribosomal protein S21 [Flavobacterium filum]|uniref:small ribosomal subunit protein bS21 n=1 Tax=Flavobacterium filum TaxID=370974 RepID=UPI0023F4FFCC|nr:30S ribosomal protein S21 [Flavobacterium filum]
MKVVKQDNESFDRLMIRFKNKVNDSKVLKLYADNQSFTSKSERNRSKRKQSKHRKQMITIQNE